MLYSLFLHPPPGDRESWVQFFHDLEDVGFELSEEFSKLKFVFGMFRKSDLLDLYQGSLSYIITL